MLKFSVLTSPMQFSCALDKMLCVAMIASLAMVKLSNPVMNLREGIGHAQLYAHVSGFLWLCKHGV